MRFSPLLILLLSFERPVVTSAPLIQRQEQGGAWPDFDQEDIFMNGVNLFRGIGEPLSNPQDSPGTGTSSDQQASPGSQEVVPASPPSSDTVPDKQASPGIPEVLPTYRLPISRRPMERSLS